MSFLNGFEKDLRLFGAMMSFSEKIKYIFRHTRLGRNPYKIELNEDPDLVGLFFARVIHGHVLACTYSLKVSLMSVSNLSES